MGKRSKVRIKIVHVEARGLSADLAQLIGELVAAALVGGTTKLACGHTMTEAGSGERCAACVKQRAN